MSTARRSKKQLQHISYRFLSTPLNDVMCCLFGHGATTADGGSCQGGGDRQEGGQAVAGGVPHQRPTWQPRQGVPRGRRLGSGELVIYNSMRLSVLPTPSLHHFMCVLFSCTRRFFVLLCLPCVGSCIVFSAKKGDLLPCRPRFSLAAVHVHSSSSFFCRNLRKGVLLGRVIFFLAPGTCADSMYIRQRDIARRSCSYSRGLWPEP